jgi:hypothetical protein
MITDAILNRAPIAPVRLNPEISPKLEEIITWQKHAVNLQRLR